MAASRLLENQLPLGPGSISLVGAVKLVFIGSWCSTRTKPSKATYIGAVRRIGKDMCLKGTARAVSHCTGTHESFAYDESGGRSCFGNDAGYIHAEH